MKHKRLLRCIISCMLTVAMVLGAVPLPFVPGSMMAHAEAEKTITGLGTGAIGNRI